MLESKLQAKCIKLAKDNGYIALKIIKCNISGCADLILLKDGKTIFIEFKSEKGKQSPLQVYFEKTIINQGFEYYLIDDFEEYYNTIIYETFKK